MKSLTDAQRTAVESTSRVVLVCGPTGTGKTHVLSRRAVALIRRSDTLPSDVVIMAGSPVRSQGIARDARNWLRTGDADPEGAPSSSTMTATTLRAWCADLLHRNGAIVGVSPNYSVYGPERVERLLGALMDQEGMRRSEVDLKRFRGTIANAKDKAYATGQIARHRLSPDEVGDSQVEHDLYAAYAKALDDACALDWQDLDHYAARVTERRPELAGDGHSFIVDDAHELSHAQHRLLQTIGTNACSVSLGWATDPGPSRDGSSTAMTTLPPWMQSNSEVHHVDLATQHRPPPPVAQAAATLDGAALDGATLDGAPPAAATTSPRSASPESETSPLRGHPPTVIEADTSAEEAQAVAALLHHYRSDPESSHRLAVIVRTPGLAETLSGHLEKEGIGVLRRYPPSAEEEPLPQLVAYLHLSVNPADRHALERVLNYPARGIGPTTRKRLRRFARSERIGMWEAIGRDKDINTMSSRQRSAVRSFREMIQRLGDERRRRPREDFLKYVLEETGLSANVAKGRTHTALKQWERLLHAARTVDEDAAQRDPHGLMRTLQVDAVRPVSRLETLHRSAPEWPAERTEGGRDRTQATSAGTQDDSASPQVTVATFSLAQDVACDVAIVCGLEEGLSPLKGRTDKETLMRRERGLLYTAITRPHQGLYLTWARSRDAGTDDDTIRKRSRFLSVMQQDAPWQSQTAAEIIGLQRGPNADTPYTKMDPHYYRTDPRAQQADPNPSVTPVDETINAIDEGTHVSHPKFGTGIVVATAGNDAKRTAEIDFGENTGVKKVRLKFANLEVVDDGSG